jgi:anaerobic ribonucleoside-triphosphate reductase activating protein
VSQDTWDTASGTPLEVDDVVGWLASLTGEPGGLDGVTISGGEPTEQADALHALVARIDGMRTATTFDGDVLCYTGRSEAEFHRACPWARDLIDAVITDPFKIADPTALLWRGSANQQLVALTERGERVYGRYRDAAADPPPLQFTVDAGQVWMIGIPRRGDLRRLESALHRDGVTLQEVSWRAR